MLDLRTVFSRLRPPCRDRRVIIRSREQWRAFAAENPRLRDPAVIAKCAQKIADTGFDFLGEHVGPGQFEFEPPHYRESFVYQGINSRKRAVPQELFDDMGRRGLRDPAIYAPEALSGFAEFLRERFPRYTGSEFLPDEVIRARHPEIEHQDLAALTYPDAVFDYVLVNDVFEHVPDLQAVLAEISRVLSRGGLLLSTFPFAFPHVDHVIKARRTADGVEHLTEPEYHGDPVNPEGALVFQVPGWRILDDCRRAGFRSAEMVFLSSVKRAILASQVPGVMILSAKR